MLYKPPTDCFSVNSAVSASKKDTDLISESDSCKTAEKSATHFLRDQSSESLCEASPNTD